MIPSPEEVLVRFAGSLSCEYEAGDPTPLAPSAMTLPYLLSSATGGCSSFPALSLKSPRAAASGRLSQGADQSTEAEKLGRIVRMGRHKLPAIPSMLLRNVLGSMRHQLRLTLERTLIVLMERYAEFDEDGGEKRRNNKQERLTDTLTELSSFDVPPIAPVAAGTKFNILDVPCAYNFSQAHVDETTVSLSLLFEASVDFIILGREVVTVFVRAPATISGVFSNAKSRPDAVDVRVDPTALFESMKKQCHNVVKKAILAAQGESSTKRRTRASRGLPTLSESRTRKSPEKSLPNAKRRSLELVQTEQREESPFGDFVRCRHSKRSQNGL